MDAKTSETPFVVYESGTRINVPNDLPEVLDEFREALSRGDDLTALYKKGELWNHARHTEAPEAVWYRLCKVAIESLQVGKKLFSRALLHFESSSKEHWPGLKNLLVQEIDEITGWFDSWQRELAEKRKIERREDGGYFEIDDDGTEYLIVGPGAKTIEEIRLDYMTDSILRSYGKVQVILRLFALFSIAMDFRSNATAYPRSLKLVLPESQWHTLQYQWMTTYYDRSRTTRWRPDPNVCDVDWLAADLHACISDVLEVDKWAVRNERYLNATPPLEEDCVWQIDCVIDGTVTIGDSEEAVIEFEGRRIRWINGTAEMKPIASIGLRDQTEREATEAFNRLNRFLSAISFHHSVGVGRVPGAAVSGMVRSLPHMSASRNNFGLKIRTEWLLPPDYQTNDDRKWFALALYREGESSHSVFYSFLNYWKVIELVVPDKKTRLAWINDAVEKMPLHADRVQAIKTSHGDVAEYLDHHCRNAIAHVFRPPSVNPDDHEEFRRIYQDHHLVRALARMALK